MVPEGGAVAVAEVDCEGLRLAVDGDLAEVLEALRGWLGLRPLVFVGERSYSIGSNYP